jgi:hypothetical protein
VKDKLIGIAFIFIATIIFLTNTVLTVWYAANLNRYIPKLGKMGTADKFIGYAPEIWTFIALGLGAFYIVRAEFREYKKRKAEL